MVRFAGVNYAANPSATRAEPRQAESRTCLGGGVNDSKGVVVGAVVVVVVVVVVVMMMMMMVN